MIILKINTMDGLGYIDVAVSERDFERLRAYVKSANEALVAIATYEEAEYYAELNRGYEQDRA